MTVWIALLRGVNVGGHRKVPMPELRAVAEAEGFVGVATHVQSGNLVMRAGEADRDGVERRLEAAIARHFGFKVAVVARDRTEWQAVVRANPFANAAAVPKMLHAFILAGPADAGAKARLDARQRADEEYELIGETLYLFTPSGIGRSKFAASVERLLAVPATARNWSTVLKLHEMAQALAPD